MLWRLLQGMDSRRFESAVIALMRGGPLADEIKALGIPVYHAEMRQGRPSLGALARVVGCLRKEKPDVVQGWMVHGNLAAQFASGFLSPRPRVLWAVHNTVETLQREKWLTARLIQLSSRLSRRRGMPHEIVYVSQVSRRQHEALGFDPEKGTVLPNGIDTGYFMPSEAHRVLLRHELGLPSSALLIGLIGRFHPQKNHGGFLCAAKNVVERHPEASIIFAGQGMEAGNERLVSMIRDYGLTGAVHLLGERRDMDMVTAGLDISVSASSYGEALSLAVAEAMASSVPCVVTDVGDHGILVGKTGIVVAPNDLEGLAEACSSLIRLGPTGRQALGATARERILRNYAMPMIVNRYQDLYEKHAPRKRS